MIWDCAYNTDQVPSQKAKTEMHLTVSEQKSLSFAPSSIYEENTSNVFEDSMSERLRSAMSMLYEEVCSENEMGEALKDSFQWAAIFASCLRGEVEPLLTVDTVFDDDVLVEWYGRNSRLVAAFDHAGVVNFAKVSDDGSKRGTLSLRKVLDVAFLKKMVEDVIYS